MLFDIEGDPFWEPARGLHFLLGLLTGEDGAWRYRAIWAHDRAEERAAFESLVDFFRDRFARYPGMHVYHYGAYEPTALKQLMGVYATREDAVDALLRAEIFVDLHSVVRQGLRAGVPSYSLKDVEALPEFQRRAQVTSGTRAVLAYERWMASREGARLDEIAAYNEEDCRATLALRDWLVDHRAEGVDWAGCPDPRPVDDDRQKADAQREALRESLLNGAEPGSPRRLTAELIEYHRREARPAWWWFYSRCAMSVDELVDDAEAIGRLEPVGAPARVGRSLDHRFRFPIQQHKLGLGDRPRDPATGEDAGTIEALDDVAGGLVLRRGPRHVGVALPEALIPPGPIPMSRAAGRSRAPRRLGAGRRRPLPGAARHPGPRAAATGGGIRRPDPDHGGARAV